MSSVVRSKATLDPRMTTRFEGSSAALSAGTPRQLFEVKGLSTTGPARGYDVTPDGQRFLFHRAVDVPPPPAPPMVLVENWIEELKRLAPASKR